LSCELTQSVLHGYVDGELDAARAADFERHLVSCAECVAALEAQEALRSSLQRAGLYERAPLTLRKKVRADLGSPAVDQIPITAVSRRPSWAWLAIAATFLLAALIGWRLVEMRGARESAYASAIVDAHLRSLQPGHLEDVVSTDQHTVKPWFDGKLDFAPPVRDFAGDGFPLQGGRLDAVGGRTVAVLVYARRKHIVNVFVWPSSGGDAAPRSGSHLGYQWLDWRKDGMEMCAVSDVAAADLDTLQQLFIN
jgi:anti-sigma factor RsiW